MSKMSDSGGHVMLSRTELRCINSQFAADQDKVNRRYLEDELRDPSNFLE